jgi:uncharacterized membrane protein YphA (DoxX/SURF4 family)
MGSAVRPQAPAASNRPVMVRGSLAACAAFFLLSAPASAHEKWFIETDGYGLRWDLFFAPLPLAFAGAVVLATIVAAILWRRRGCVDFIPGPEIFGTTPQRRRIVYGLLPLIVGIHFAVPLLANGTATTLFSPNDHLHGALAYTFGVLETGVALALFYGAFTRLAALILGAMWLTSFVVVGPEIALENALFGGAAAFFFLAGRGPIAIDRLMFPRLEPPAWMIRAAELPLRVGLGISLTTVAFTEKFANLPLALHFLQKYPLNFTRYLGIPMPNDIFVLCAASVELLVGLWILFGIFPREIIILAWLPFNLTLSVFNQTELIGHLPIYGIMALLLIWIPGRPNLDEWVEGVTHWHLSVMGDQSAAP